MLNALLKMIMAYCSMKYSTIVGVDNMLYTISDILYQWFPNFPKYFAWRFPTTFIFFSRSRCFKMSMVHRQYLMSHIQRFRKFDDVLPFVADVLFILSRSPIL